MSFNLDSFVRQCNSALEADKPQRLITEHVELAISNPTDLMDELGEPKRASIEKLFVSQSLTILNVIWAPKMTIMPHNHNTWAVIGVYSGREDNIFWRRLKDNDSGKIEAAGAKSISVGQVLPLGKNIIHSLTNPTSMFTGALHVYGGNFFEIERSEWNPLDLSEGPYDVEKTLGLFETENLIQDIRMKDSA